MEFFSVSLADQDQKMTEKEKIKSIGQGIHGVGKIIMVLLDGDASEAIVGIVSE